MAFGAMTSSASLYLFVALTAHRIFVERAKKGLKRRSKRKRKGEGAAKQLVIWQRLGFGARRIAKLLILRLLIAIAERQKGKLGVQKNLQF